jgi:hypothetical protein
MKKQIRAEVRAKLYLYAAKVLSPDHTLTEAIIGGAVLCSLAAELHSYPEFKIFKVKGSVSEKVSDTELQTILLFCHFMALDKATNIKSNPASLSEWIKNQQKSNFNLITNNNKNKQNG